MSRAQSTGPVEDKGRAFELYVPSSLSYKTDGEQMKLAMLCVLKIHKHRCLLVSGYICPFDSSSHLGEQLLPQLCFWLIAYISSVTVFLMVVIGISAFSSEVEFLWLVCLASGWISLCTVTPVPVCIRAHPILLKSPKIISERQKQCIIWSSLDSTV